jgi:tetratricopeptide (TPR) repeat protein
VSVSPSDLREIKARHILIRIQPGKEEEARKLAESLLNRAKNGEDFAALAKQYSEDPGTKKNGGDLGFFSTGSMVKPFEDLAFSLKVGEIGGPIKTDFGYHIIKVEDARLKKFKGEPDPEKAILKEKQERAYNEWSYNLRKNAKVEILNPALKALDLKFRGRIGEAIAEYQQAIASDPSNPYYHVFLGLIYEETNKLDLAIAEYKEAILREPGEYSYYITLGEAYQKNKQVDLAIEQFKKASMIAGDDKSSHQELSKLFKAVKRPDLSLLELKEISRIEKKEAFEKSLKEGTKVKTD